MSIIRVIAVDPKPRLGSHSDVLVYQVPENSREYELLTELLDKGGLEWTRIDSPRRNGKQEKNLDALLPTTDQQSTRGS